MKLIYLYLISFLFFVVGLIIVVILSDLKKQIKINEFLYSYIDRLHAIINNYRINKNRDEKGED